MFGVFNNALGSKTELLSKFGSAASAMQPATTRLTNLDGGVNGPDAKYLEGMFK